jgi:16S rRNA (cytosine967-C5)-methyltransferase
MTGAAARRIAYDVLRAVSERGAFANLALPTALREARLDTRDAALATELTYGTLRWRGFYDAVIEVAANRSLDDIDAGVLDGLRLGAHQLLGTAIAPHAAVHETVALVRDACGHRVSGFTNAVLRRIGSDDREGWVERVAPAFSADPIGHLSVAQSHPRWIVEAFDEALGGDRAELAAACAADNVAPDVHLVARPHRIGRDELLALAGAAARPTSWSRLGVVMHGGDPAQLAAVRDGRAAVQDEGSQLAAVALIESDVEGPDNRWLDMCAGPGGKAALLADYARGAGAALLAADRSVHRAALARRAVGNDANIVVADGATSPWRRGWADRVLLDTPCTGLGALRRRPDLRWSRSPDELAALTALQRRLLDAAIGAVRPGGLIAYVTCSPHRAETVDIVAPVVAAGAVTGVPVDFARDMSGARLGDGPVPEALQLWPHRHGTDAMFIAVLRRAG